MKENINELYQNRKGNKNTSEDIMLQSSQLKKQESTNQDISVASASMYFKELLSSELKVPVHKIEEDVPMDEYGIDSVMVMQMTNKLEETFGTLPKTLFFEYQTIEELTGYFISEYQPKLNEILGSNQKQSDTKPFLPQERVILYFKELLSAELKVPKHKIEDDVPMEEYGIDSVMIMQMTIKLEEEFGALPKTLFFEYRTIEEIAVYFLEEHLQKLKDILGVADTGSRKKLDESHNQELNQSHDQELKQIHNQGFNQEFKKDFDKNQYKGLNNEQVQQERHSPFKAFKNEKSNRNRRFSSLIDEVQESQNTSLDIAVIGIAGRYPQADNINQYWDNLKAGRNCITEIPADRWDYNTYYDKDKSKQGKINSKWGGFLNGVYNFDPLFFNISPHEAELMDPQERLFLECVHETLEDSGYTREACSRYKENGLEGNIGVFVGALFEEYQFYGVQEQTQGNMIAMYGHLSSIANRSSHFFNFHGPSMAVDTLCSSSLTAVHLACQGLQKGDCEMAIAGGVNVSLHPNKYLLLGQNNFLSSKGLCESFGEGGDGYVPGEGVGAILLKPLHKAVADGDQIYGVIKSTAINHGGKTNGYTVPNPNAQSEVIRRAYQKADINPRAMGYIEAHGTGTILGDPIEITGLNKVFSEYTKEKQFCKIGSVKSNIGHCESAAGIAGITKILLQMKYGYLVPSLHAKVQNPNIDFSSTAFEVQQELEPWKRPVLTIDGEAKEYPRMAGISSFGAGGSNAHIVIEEYRKPNKKADLPNLSRQIFVISAKDEKKLKQYAGRFQRFIDSDSNQEEDKDNFFHNLAYTMQIGREPMQERIAIVASDLLEVKQKLLDYVNEEEYIPNLYQGNSKSLKIKDVFQGLASEEFVKSLIKGHEFDKIAELWVSGISIDWNLLYSLGSDLKVSLTDYLPRRISIPSYPFAKGVYSLAKAYVDPQKSKDQITNELQVEGEDGNYFYIPKWERMKASEYKNSTNKKPGKVLLIFGEASVGISNLVEELHKDDEIIKAKLDTQWEKISQKEYRLDTASLQSFETLLAEISQIDTLYYFGGMTKGELNTNDLEYLDFIQEQSVLGLFRLIKSMVNGGYESRNIALKLVTNNVYKILPQDICLPYAAGAFGLAKSVDKEFPNWQISGFDIDLFGRDILSKEFDSTIKAIVNDTMSISQSEIVIRDNIRYSRNIYPVNLPLQGDTKFREGGVYLIVGGAGGIGFQLSLYIAKKYLGKLVLIGRSELNQEMEGKIKQIEAMGGEALYLQGDVANPQSMAKVIRDAKSKFGTINGVIHSALVLQDQSIRNMEEGSLKQVLAPKVNGSVVLHNAIKEEELDFLMYFSSGQTFIGNAGQSNYAAACAFTDSFALYEKEEGSYPVKLINWGYWGEVGIVASEEYNMRLTASGIYPINTSEGINGIEKILNSSMSQTLAIKASKSVLKDLGVDFDYRVCTYPREDMPLGVDILREEDMPELEIDRLQVIHESFNELRKFTGLVLLDAFQKKGIFTRIEQNYSLNEIKKELNILEKYNRLFHSMLDILEHERAIIHMESDRYTTSQTIESELLKNKLLMIENEKETLLGKYPMVTPFMELLWTCSRHFWEILSGECFATDIVFPNSSMKLVEGIYNGNEVSDYLNKVITWTLTSYIEKRLTSLQGNDKIKILEIGAGTGGTSRAVFKGLQKYGEKLQYDFTDISEAFLKHGQESFGAENPYVRFKQLNIEKEILSQGYLAGEYDIILATNVLHATININNTIKNAKTLLKNSGWLVLNENTKVEDVATLTFGLLDGWWLFDDESSRMKSSPLLSNQMWRNLLHEEGYKNVKQFGQPENQDLCLFQNVIICENDGEVKLLAMGEDRTNKDLNQPKFMKVNRTSPNSPATMQKDKKSMEQHVEHTILDCLVEVLKINKSDLDINTPYKEYGVDSILSGQIINKINTKLGIELNSTALFNYPTTCNLKDFILKKFIDVLKIDLDTKNNEENESMDKAHLEQPKENLYTNTSANENKKPNPSMDIAVVGMSGMFPGANTLKEYWDNLCSGKNSVGEIDRWELDSFYHADSQVPNKSYVKTSGMLKDADKFDPLFFNISPREAELMDPQQRLFLQEAWKALEDAGFSDGYLDGRKCGVYVGCNESYYMQLIEECGIEKSNYIFTGNTLPILSARISYLLNLRGPSVVVTTACSSSLVALHHACASILSGDSEIALSGGVNVFPTPYFHTLASSTGMLSYQDECRPFDNMADGFIPAEGVGAVVLKKLDKAIEDGDHIYGVIVGTGINQDGKSNGITAPSAPSQSSLEYDIYKKYQINPENISYIEAHGTGTKLGDPIEIEALSESFEQFTDKKQFCAIGSVKANIGHALEASGMASLMKVLLCMKYKKLVPSINYKAGNELIRFQNSPVYVNTEYKDWNPPVGTPRLAAISAFGISGTNSHMVIREYEDASIPKQIPSQNYLVAMSAKTEKGLRNKLTDLANWLREDNKATSLGDIAYTLMVGRCHFSYRVAFVVNSINEFIQELELAINHSPDKKMITGEFISNNFRPEPKVLKAADELLGELNKTIWADDIKKEKLNYLGELYVKGYSLNWGALYQPLRYKKISLPTYPFDQERYWVEKIPNVESAKDRKALRIHPLIGQNTSTLKKQKYTTQFQVEEFFIKDHQIDHKKIMPGAAYIEMVRAGGEIAAELPVKGIKNIIWGSPLVIADTKEVSLGLSPWEDGQVHFELYTKTKGEHVIHAQGNLDFEENKSSALLLKDKLNLNSIKTRCDNVVSGEECYGTFRAMGLEYGSSFQVIEELYNNSSEVLAYLKLPEALTAGFYDYVVHPSMLDGALQAAIGLINYLEVNKKAAYVPFLIQEIHLLKPLETECYAYVTKVNESIKNNSFTFNIHITNKEGEVLTIIDGYNIRELQKKESQNSTLDLLKQLENGSLSAWEVEMMMGEAND